MRRLYHPTCCCGRRFWPINGHEHTICMMFSEETVVKSVFAVCLTESFPVRETIIPYCNFDMGNVGSDELQCIVADGGSHGCHCHTPTWCDM